MSAALSSLRQEDLAVVAMERRGFRVVRRSVQVAPRVSFKIDALCASREHIVDVMQHPAHGPGRDDENCAGSPIAQLVRPQRNLVWVKVGRGGKRVGSPALSSLFGMFAYLILSRQFRYLPSQIYVFTSDRFSPAARQLAKATNDLFGREFFVLLDGRALKKWTNTEARS